MMEDDQSSLGQDTSPAHNQNSQSNDDPSSQQNLGT